MIERTIYESQFIKLFFEKLDLQTDYCILRGYEKLPQTTGNDIDIMISRCNPDEIEKIIGELGWIWIKKHDEDGFLSYVCWGMYDNTIAHIIFSISSGLHREIIISISFPVVWGNFSYPLKIQ